MVLKRTVLRHGKSLIPWRGVRNVEGNRVRNRDFGERKKGKKKFIDNITPVEGLERG